MTSSVKLCFSVFLSLQMHNVIQINYVGPSLHATSFQRSNNVIVTSEQYIDVKTTLKDVMCLLVLPFLFWTRNSYLIDSADWIYFIFWLEFLQIFFYRVVSEERVYLYISLVCFSFLKEAIVYLTNLRPFLKHLIYLPSLIRRWRMFDQNSNFWWKYILYNIFIKGILP